MIVHLRPYDRITACGRHLVGARSSQHRNWKPVYQPNPKDICKLCLSASSKGTAYGNTLWLDVAPVVLKWRANP